MSNGYYLIETNDDGSENDEVNTKAPKSQTTFCCCCTRKCVLRLFLNLLFIGILGGILALTYNRCVWCVIGVAIVSALTMNCVPLTPLVFMLSLCVLLMHAIDYRRASFRVEVPLQDVIYIPTWDDMQRYVHIDKSLGATR